MEVFTVGASNSYDVTKESDVAEYGATGRGLPPRKTPKELTREEKFKLAFLVLLPCAFFLYAVIYMAVIM